jgi:hypothetical protein
MNFGKSLLRSVVIVSVLAFAGAARAQSPVAISVDPDAAGAAIPPDFTGLSFEVNQLLPDATGKHYFRPDNKPLIHLFHTLGIRNLRIGGNSSDRDVRRLPEPADLDNLFQFAKAADVKVIYCLRLHNGDPQVDVQTAKYIMDRYAAQMDSFSIGQEPSAYPRMTNATRAAEGMGGEFEKYSYDDYAKDWKKFADAIIAAVPDVKFCGPSVHNNGQWAVRFMNDFGRSNHVVLVTEHLYPGGAGGKVPTPEIGRARMLATAASMTNAFPRAYQKLYDSFVPLAISNNLPVRLEEVNNYFNGGAASVSDTFAASLWGLDFMYWWAERGTAGLNFHTGDRVSAGYSLQPSKYTAFFSTTNGYLIRPLGYGIKAFELGSHGRLTPVTLSNSDNVNLSAYAVLGVDKTLWLTVINKENGDNARDAVLTIDAGPLHTNAQAVFLTAPDLGASNTVTLGGARINIDASWDGKRTRVTNGSDGGPFTLNLPASSAAVIKLPRRPNYDEAKVGTYTLPDPLVLDNGNRVTSPRDWKNQRRPEILSDYFEDIHGRSPARPSDMVFDVWDVDRHALGGRAVRKQIDIKFASHTNSPVLHVLLYTPADVTGPVPTFLCIHFNANYQITTDPGVKITDVWDNRNDTRFYPTNLARGTAHSWKIDETLARGYGIAAIYYEDIEPDFADGTGWKHGVRSMYLPPDSRDFPGDSWGAISAWAWGASRVLDYLMTDRDVDHKRVVMLGHSRLGKTALWAGAQDTRFAMVIASCSGEMGAALSRRDYGETIDSMIDRFSYQFCPDFQNYKGRWSDLPVDAHCLVSLVAPRPLYLSTASMDQWADPHGEFLSAQAASPVYALFGKQGLDKDTFPPLDTAIMREIAFSCHTGKHDIYPSDWDHFLTFADLHFGHGKK